MHPNQAVLEHGTRLTLDEFAAEFRRAWSRLERRFLKLECWQHYQEQPHNTSQQAFQRGDVERAADLLRQEADKDRPLYDDIRVRNLDFARIRLVREPLSDYLAYELMSYRIRAELGESIVVHRVGQETRLPNSRLFDFLLFDQHTALVHDYGAGDVGVQTGGWLIHDTSLLNSLEKTVMSIRHRAVDIDEFMRSTYTQQPPSPATDGRK